MNGARIRQRRKRINGMTLVELLIVVAVLMILMSVSIPLVRRATEQDKVREASRQINGFFAGAQVRAIERGRPFGVWIQRSAQNPDMAMELYYAESPPPYSGDVTDAFATLLDTVGSTDTDTIVDYVEISGLTGSLVAKVIKEDDLIRFDNKGSYYVIGKPDTSASTTAPNFITKLPLKSTLGIPMPSPVGASVRYQILRQPMKRGSSPLQLAGGACIDLRNSGVGSDGSEFRFSSGDADHVVIAFGPRGDLEYLYYDFSAQSFYGPVHLLVGRVDKMIASSEDASSPNPISVSATSGTVTETYNQNVTDQTNIWVTIGKHTGAVTTAENAWILNPPGPWSGTSNPKPPYYRDSLRAAREFAHMGQSMGGR